MQGHCTFPKTRRKFISNAIVMGNLDDIGQPSLIKPVLTVAAQPTDKPE